MKNYKCTTNVLKLRKIMLDKGCNTIGELSAITNINRNTLGQVLNGATQPSSYVMNQLVLALDIPPRKAGEIFFNSNLRNEKEKPA